MKRNKSRVWLCLIILLFTLILNTTTIIVYANEADEGSEVNVHITTTMKEFEKLYEWFLKDRYNVNVDGELNVRAYKKEEVPVTKLEDSRGYRMLLTNGIIDFFSRHWPYITGGLILVFIVIFIRAAKSHNYEDDYFYEEPPFQYNQWGLEEGQPRINLAQKLERMGAKPLPNVYYYTNMYDNGVYFVPQRDYSRYNQNNQSTLIRQKVMYYK